MVYENFHLVYLEVGDRLGDSASEEADLDLLVNLLTADGDLEEHLVCHLRSEIRTDYPLKHFQFLVPTVHTGVLYILSVSASQIYPPWVRPRPGPGCLRRSRPWRRR